MNMPPPPPPPPMPPGQMPPGYTAYTQQPVAGYASWGLRLGARILDGLAGGVPYWIMALIGGGIGGGVGVLFIFVGAAWALYFQIRNIIIEGRTGQGFGKSVLGIKLISESSGQPIGGWTVFGRQIVHIVDAIPCYLGFFWPLWDAKKQTFADKILSTVVVSAEKTEFGQAFTKVAKP
jgi:uncharacterized RDD family membrane protein YckC